MGDLLFRKRLFGCLCWLACCSSVWACGDDAARSVAAMPAAPTCEGSAADGGNDCRAQADAGVRVVGSACGADGDCAQNRCVTRETRTMVEYPGGYCSGACSRDQDCGEIGVCATGALSREGSCYRGCADDWECDREGYRCRSLLGVGRCVPGSPPLRDHVVGAACESDSECGGAAGKCATQLIRAAAPGGYCSQACVDDSDCGAGGTCINGIHVPSLASGTCFKACHLQRDCREGYECRSVDATTGDVIDRGACAPKNAEADAGAP